MIYACAPVVNNKPVVCDSHTPGVLRFRRFTELGRFAEAYVAKPSFFIFESRELQQTKNDNFNYWLQTSSDQQIKYIATMEQSYSFIFRE